MKKKKQEKIIQTKGQALVDFVLRRYYFSKERMQQRQESWREYYADYRGQTLATKEPWQANYVIPVLKEVVRIKVPLYLNILFSNGLESFDIQPAEESDEPIIPALKSKLVYDLRNTGKNRGGLFGVWNEFIKQYEIYGYSVAKVPWRTEVDKQGNVIFDAPDMEVVDIFNFYPDPTCLTLDSWKIIEIPNMFISQLRGLEKKGIYTNIQALKDTSQPVEIQRTEIDNQVNELPPDKVNLLEYHGEVPLSLLEGDLWDEAEADPYTDEYVDAIITIGNRQVVIRAEKYPYKCGNIFIEACKDRMPNEKFGIGTGEDIQSLSTALTQAYNTFDDCISIVTLPTAIVNPNRVQLPGDSYVVKPGGVIFTNSMVDNVAHAISFLETNSAAVALSPLITFIRMLDEKLQKLTHAVPVISPAVTAKDLPETLGATQIMQSNASEPIKHEVKHILEPAFINMLEIYYKHNLQFFKEESVYRILGEKEGEIWEEEQKKYLKKQDITLKRNPDFIAKGVSVFQEKNMEAMLLLKFLEVVSRVNMPATDAMGRPVLDESGKPVMLPKADVGEIIKRLAEQFNFKDIDKLLPYLREEKERKEIQNKLKSQMPKINPQAGMPTPASPPQAGLTSPTKPAGGGINPALLQQLRKKITGANQ